MTPHPERSCVPNGILIAGLLCVGLSAAAARGAYTEKIFAIPDYTQNDPAYGGFPSGDYCAPVSVSNSFMWLSDHGFPNLTNHTSDRKRDQHDLAYEIGTQYMDAVDGTSANELCEGLRNYLQDRGCTYERLQYQGWRYVSAEFDMGVEVPSLDWVKQGVEGLGSVWLNVGWYDYDAATTTYTRIGGHWITLVGHGHDGQQDNDVYLIGHDPAARAGSDFANEYVLPVTIDSGSLAGDAWGLPRDATGYCKLMGGMHIKSGADFGILDGAVVLTMTPEPGSWLLLGLASALLARRRPRDSR